MCFLSRGTSELLVAGCQGKMFKVDVEKGEVISTVRSSSPVDATVMLIQSGS